MRALIVDDDALNRDILRRFLGRLGYDSEEAASGLEGLAACRNARYDVALIDLVLPDLDGADAATAIREACAARDTPIRLIAVTGARSDERVRRAFDAVVEKPYTLDELSAAISALS